MDRMYLLAGVCLLVVLVAILIFRRLYVIAAYGHTVAFNKPYVYLGTTNKKLKLAKVRLARSAFGKNPESVGKPNLFRDPGIMPAKLAEKHVYRFRKTTLGIEAVPVNDRYAGESVLNTQLRLA